MKELKCKKRILVLSILLMILFCTRIFALEIDEEKEAISVKVEMNEKIPQLYNNSEWIIKSDGKFGLKVHYENGEFIVVNGFVDVLSVENNIVIHAVYYFDNNGDMVTGWIKDSKNDMYYMREEQNEFIGRMAIGWVSTHSGLYYLNEDGSLLRNSITPDGNKVDENGRFINPEEIKMREELEEQKRLAQIARENWAKRQEMERLEEEAELKAEEKKALEQSLAEKNLIEGKRPKMTEEQREALVKIMSERLAKE